MIVGLALWLLTGCASHIKLIQPGAEQDVAECRAPRAIWLRWPTTQRQEAACLIARGYQAPVPYEFRTSVITTAKASAEVTATMQPLPTADEVMAALLACEGELLAEAVPSSVYRGPDWVDTMLLIHGLPMANFGIGELASKYRNGALIYQRCLEPRGYQVGPRS